MPRKLQIKIRDWLPFIITCYFEREPFSLYETCVLVGRRRIDISSADEQLNEIRLVYQYLMEKGYLIKIQLNAKVHYWGIDFIDEEYSPIQPAFDNLIASVRENNPTKQQQQNHVVINITTNNKVYWLNIEKLFDTLFKIDAKLF